MRGRVFHIIALLLLIAGVSSCFKDPNFDFKASGEGSGSNLTPSRTESPDVRNVLLYIAAGFNSLSNFLADDIQDLESSPLPGRNSPTDPVLLVLSRLPRDPYYADYLDPVPPVLFRMYADEKGEPVCDTLLVWSAETPLTKASTLTEAFEYMNDAFPGNRYGVIYSSHGSGWLPPLYYENPSHFEPTASYAPGKDIRGWHAPEEFPAIQRRGETPEVKSVGVDSSDGPDLELDLDAFAAAIPYHLDYILFDACLMGCVEVAYELREKADLVGFSQTEVLAEGFDYKSLSSHLLTKDPDPEAVCRDYFNYYNAQSGSKRSATISLVDTRKMGALEEVCRQLFEKYRVQINSLPGSLVQGYFRFNRHYFYDLKDILVNAGITEAETLQLQAALDQCILYKAATPYFFQGGNYGFAIKNYSGLSMYLPSMGSAYLDNYYLNHIAWNKATSLVK